MITYKELSNLIKTTNNNNFYLLISKDFYRIEKALKQFKNLITNDMNYSVFDASKIEDVKEITNATETYPFCDTKRIVVINDIDLTKDKKLLDSLLKFIPKMAPHTILILLHYVKDPRENYKTNTIVKKAEKIAEGSVVYESKISMEDLKEIVKEESISIDSKVMTLFLNADNLDVARNDMRKLAFINNLTLEKAKENVSSSNEIDVFKLTDAIKNKDLDKSMIYIKDLKDGGEGDIGICINILRAFKLLYDCKVLSNLKFSESQIATKLKTHPYPIKLACGQCKNFSQKTLETAINLCLEFDIGVKKGIVGNLEILLIKILAI